MPSNGAPRNYGSVPAHAQFSAPRAPLAIQGGPMTQQGPPSTAAAPPGPPPHGWTGNYGGSARPLMQQQVREIAPEQHRQAQGQAPPWQQGPPPPKGSAPPWNATGYPPPPPGGPPPSARPPPSWGVQGGPTLNQPPPPINQPPPPRGPPPTARPPPPQGHWAPQHQQQQQHIYTGPPPLGQGPVPGVGGVHHGPPPTM